MLPFAVLGDIAGNEITHSTAAVVMGGLVTSTALTLFVLPALYLHLARGSLAARADRAAARTGGAGPRPAARNLITEGESTCCTGTDGWRARRSSPPSRSPAAARRPTFDNEAASDEGPSRLETVKGSDVPRVDPDRAGRAAHRHRDVARARHRGARARRPRSIPYAAIIYDAEGHAFTYTSPSPADVRPDADHGRPRHRAGRAARARGRRAGTAGRDRRRPGAAGRRVRRRRGLTGRGARCAGSSDRA